MIKYQKFDLSQYMNCHIVTDGYIAELYNIQGDNVYLLPRGEKAKSFGEVEKLCHWLLSRDVKKRDTVVAIGGGSIGDTVGFVASIYKRGVKLVHVPTTLIAQIDSSIGGKTAIDLDGVKNAVGGFYFNTDTIIDTRFLDTLDAEQKLSGLGELIKYRMLSGRVEEAYNEGKGFIKECVSYKDYLCTIDPFDSDERLMLNFGHTVGHAMELYYGIPHGVAVANGIYYETQIAVQLGICSQSYADKWCKEVTDTFTIYPINTDVLNLMKQDKKNGKDGVCVILPESFSYADLTFEQLEQLLTNV